MVDHGWPLAHFVPLQDLPLQKAGAVVRRAISSEADGQPSYGSTETSSIAVVPTLYISRVRPVIESHLSPPAKDDQPGLCSE